MTQLDSRRLTAAKILGLAAVPPEAEWFANIHNKQTRRANQNDTKDVTGFVGIKLPAECLSYLKPSPLC